MVNATEHDERNYLEVIREKLLFAIRRIDERVKQHATELRQKKEYMYEHQSGMDEADQVAADQSINRMVSTGENTVVLKRKLIKLNDSPYFGRIDFAPTGGNHDPIYVGIHTFVDESQRKNLIFDWRAPVSSMFYDFELGDAYYQTPAGKVTGTISHKRQFKIREGKMEFMFDTDVSVQDDVLQHELGKSSDDKMKNIVATIQRDQNAVIRNESATVMVIQGVAGSGKTSIALHRIAFLLYRFRDSIKAKDILILSPNKVFADYISNVLPELGEEQIPELGMEELANEVLQGKFRFQNFFDQVSQLLHHPAEDYVERIRFKSSFQFLSLLNRYFIHIENNYFNFAELKVAGVVVPFPYIEERFKAYTRMPILQRFPEVVNEVSQYARNKVGRKLTPRDKMKIAEEVPAMFKLRNMWDLYKDFYAWIGKPEMLKMLPGDQLEYADVFPLLYCKIRFEGAASYDHIKHLLVDEMQDYNPVQYAVLSRLFKCKKTILGDVNQTVNPYSSSSSEIIEQVFPQADIVKLVRSYRSSWEISQFAHRIKPNPELIAMKRHGAEPEVKGFASNAEEIDEIKLLVETFQKSKQPTLGVICKTQTQADLVYKNIKGSHVFLLNQESTTFKQGVIVTTVHLSKGLEFDEVVIPFASARNYQTEVDRSLLYIACTRAMHRLTLTYAKEKSAFLVDASQEN